MDMGIRTLMSLLLGIIITEMLVNWRAYDWCLLCVDVSALYYVTNRSFRRYVYMARRKAWVIRYLLNLINPYCTTFLRKSRDLSFPFWVRLGHAFCSLSSPDRTRSRTVCVWSDPGVILERFRSTPWSLSLRPPHLTWSQIKHAKPSLHSHLMKQDPIHLVLAYSSKKPQIYSCCPFNK